MPIGGSAWEAQQRTITYCPYRWTNHTFHEYTLTFPARCTANGAALPPALSLRLRAPCTRLLGQQLQREACRNSWEQGAGRRCALWCREQLSVPGDWRNCSAQRGTYVYIARCWGSRSRTPLSFWIGFGQCQGKMWWWWWAPLLRIESNTSFT